MINERGTIDLFYTLNDKPLGRNTWERYMEAIPAKFRSHCLSYKKWQDRQACLLGKLLLIESLNNYGYDRQLLGDYQTNQFGKPYITECIDFSISHSGSYVVCAATNVCGDIGVDVERISSVRLSDFETIFRSDILESIKGSDTPESDIVRYWTMIESAIKADGRGLNITFDQIDVSMDELLVKIENAIWRIKNIDLDRGHTCHVASKVRHLNINPIFVDYYGCN